MCAFRAVRVHLKRAALHASFSDKQQLEVSVRAAALQEHAQAEGAHSHTDPRVIVAGLVAAPVPSALVAASAPLLPVCPGAWSWQCGPAFTLHLRLYAHTLSCKLARKRLQYIRLLLDLYVIEV